MGEAEPVTITIGDHVFRVRAAADQRDAFQRAEREANRRLAELVRNAGAMSGARALAMLTFEVCIELDDLRREAGLAQQGRERINKLLARLDNLANSHPE